jgi:lipoprotein-releasing system ATP-binding protein
MNAKPLLAATDLFKSYHDGERELKVLRGASLTVGPGQAVAVVGMSGSGKSTLLHMLGGLDRPDKGELFFDGDPIHNRPLSRLHEYRNRSIGFVFQFHHLLPEFTALENVMIPAMMQGGARNEIRDRALASLDRLGLADRVKHRPSRLSGGEQQRVALARALINQPALLLADEPTGNLDIHTGEGVIKLIWEMTVEAGRGLVIVTHEPLIAQRAGVILLLRDGRLHPISHADYAKQMTAVKAT